MRKVDLFYSKTDDDVRSIIAYVEDETGDLVIDGQDIGPLVERIWGDSDYEYWLRIPRAEKEKLYRSLAQPSVGPDHAQKLDGELLAALLHRFNDSGAFTAIRDWCGAHGIPAAFSSYT